MRGALFALLWRILLVQYWADFTEFQAHSRPPKCDSGQAVNDTDG